MKWRPLSAGAENGAANPHAFPIYFTESADRLRRYWEQVVFVKKAQKSRGSPVWPVLPALGVPTQAGTRPRPLFLDRRSLFPCAHRWLPRCVVGTIRAFLMR